MAQFQILDRSSFPFVHTSHYYKNYFRKEGRNKEVLLTHLFLSPLHVNITQSKRLNKMSLGGGHRKSGPWY